MRDNENGSTGVGTGTTTYQFPTLTNGINYTNPARPRNEKLAIPAQGISDRDKKMQLATLQRLQNAWEVVGKKAEVEKTMHGAHSKSFQAQEAAVQAGTSLVKAGTTWNKFQVAITDNRISRAEKNAAISGMEVEIKKIGAELDKKREALEKSEMELQQAILENSNKRQDLQESKILAHMEGYAVVPQLESFTRSIKSLTSTTPDLIYEVQAS
jgi:hypothetical protein